MSEATREALRLAKECIETMCFLRTHAGQDDDFHGTTYADLRAAGYTCAMEDMAMDAIDEAMSAGGR